MNRTSIVVFLSAAALLSGCRRNQDPGTTSDPAAEQVASDGLEATVASEQSTHIGNLIFSAVGSQDPDKAADDVAPPAKLWPTGCVTRAKDPSNPRIVHVTFDDCTGPFGLVHLNGEMVATFSAGQGGALHADIAGMDLSANGHPLTYSATADITVSGAERNVTWHGAWTATTQKGKTVAHTSDLTIAVDTAAGCVTSNGKAVTGVDDRSIETTIKDYEVCKSPSGEVQCPSGEVDHVAKPSGVTVKVVFDGSDQAAVTGPKGNTTDVQLVCTPAGGA